MKMYTLTQVLLTAPLTFMLMGVIFICSIISFRNPSFFYKMLLHPYLIVRSGAYYKVFSAELVHVDWLHLVVNELSLLFVCGHLEHHLRMASPFGSLQYLVIYLSGLLSGNAAVIWSYRNNVEFSSAGASGGIMGCMLSFMLLEPAKIAFYMPVIGGVKNEFDALIYIAAMIALRRRIGKTGINYELHFWGGLGGAVMTVLLYPGIL